MLPVVKESQALLDGASKSDSLPGQNFALNGQKNDKTWHDGGWHTTWTKMWCKMVRKSTMPCNNLLPRWIVMWDGQKFNNTLQDNRWLTNCAHVIWDGQKFNNMQDNSLLTLWTKCHVRGQKFNNTLQDNSWLTIWMKCHMRWSEITTTSCETMVDWLPAWNVM